MSTGRRTCGWQHGFEEQLVYANLVADPMLGSGLKPSIPPGSATRPTRPLPEHLAALVRQDAGDDRCSSSV